MAKSKTEHVIIRNSKIFCSHCGREQTVPFPIEIPVFVAMSKAFTKSHANCPKTWEQPKVNPELSEQQKAAFWLLHGERGSSSNFMFEVLSGHHTNPVPGSIPYDPDDFKRCHGLLEMVPEWRNKLDLMKPMSASWSNLIDNWEKLTELFKEQWITRKDNGMYDLMKSLRVD